MIDEFKRELFLIRQFEANSFQIGKVKINSSIQDLDVSEIVDIYVDQDGYQNLKLADRLDLLLKKTGWVHYAAGASFKIENGAVKQIKLSTRFLQDKKTTKQEILTVFGQPDIELVDDTNYDPFNTIDAFVLVYRQKQIYAFVDAKTEILKELRFGVLDEKLYGQKNKTNR